MRLRNPFLFLVLMVLAFSCIAGCTSAGGGYGSTPNPTTAGGPRQTVTIELTAVKMAFDTSTITVPAGAPVVVNFHNREPSGSSQVTGISHNFAVYDSPDAKTTIFRGDIITGGQDAVYRFTAPAAPGTYFFRCDVHPALMTGKFIVQ
jgi:plastocyanin